MDETDGSGGATGRIEAEVCSRNSVIVLRSLIVEWAIVEERISVGNHHSEWAE